MVIRRHLDDLLIMATILVCLAGHVVGSAESDANSVEIKVYPASSSDWSSTIETTFKTTVSSQASIYCASSPSSCNLANAVTFSSSDVEATDETESSRSLELKVYIRYPANTNLTSGASTTEVLPSAAVKAILEDARDSVKGSIDMYITYIADDYFGVPPESTANRIMIPLASLTVVAVGIAAVIMVYAQEKQEKEARQAARLAKKKAARTLPNYDIPEDPSVGNTPSKEQTAAAAAATIPPPSALSPRRQNNNSNAIPPQLQEKAKRRKATSRGAEENEEKDGPRYNSVNHFHANGNTSGGGGEYGSILPPLTNTPNSYNNNNNSGSNSTTTTTIGANYNNYHNVIEQPGDREADGEERYNEAAEKEERRRRKKEKKKEKKRMLQEQEQRGEAGFELKEAQGFDVSTMTVSEASEAKQDEIPTFTVQRL